MNIKNNKIIAQTTSFSSEKWKHCLKYIRNHSQHSDIIKLLKIIGPLHPLFDISKEKLYAKIYDETTYKDYRYRNLIYRFGQLLKSYLQNNTEDSLQINHLLYVRKLKQLNNKIDYKRELYDLNLINQNKQDSTVSYFLAHEKMEQLQQSNDRQIDRNIQTVNEALDIHYINEKLKMVCLAINDSKINNKSYHLGILSLIEQNLESLIEDKKSYTYLLYQCYLFQKYEKVQSFYAVLKDLQQLKKIKDSEELRLIFTMCINYCIGQINKGKQDFFNHLFSIYKMQIAYKLIYDENGFIAAFTMKNILTVSLREKEYKWSENFIQTHQDKLPILYREENFNYMLARLNYSKKAYKKALQLLLLSEPQDFLNNLSSRVLMIKCWYDADDFEQLDNALQNFKLYLLRHKNKSYHYTFHVNFIKYLQQITKFTFNKKEKANIEAKIKLDQQVAEKRWLLDILNA